MKNNLVFRNVIRRVLKIQQDKRQVFEPALRLPEIYAKIMI